MAQPTQTYKHSFAGSVGAGVSSIFKANGKSYYILEHKVSSKYHRAGEAQEIIVDQIEIGRDPKCAVQFDESFQTVSRKHAAIVRDGQNWKLIQLSTTNKTFLNGKPIQNQWYLQSGDEIQLSVNGPKLGFILPTGKKSTVASIGLSRRLSLFRQQALRPYKTAMTILSTIILLLICGGIALGIWGKRQIDDLSDIIAQYRQQIISISQQNEELANIIARQDSINKVIEEQNKILDRKIKNMPKTQPTANIAALIKQVKPSVYYIITHVCYETEDGKINEKKELASGGTGFLLDNGTFVTARHCVEPWLYGFDDNCLQINATNEKYKDTFVSIIEAVNINGDIITFAGTDFSIDRSKDQIKTFADDKGNELKIRIAKYDGKYGEKSMGSTDWATVKIDINGNTLKKGNISIDKNLSTSLTAGTEVHVLGFPASIGVLDAKNSSAIAEPIYNNMKVAREGLNNSGLIMVSQGVAHGNSGGPVFTLVNGQLKAIAVVSRLMYETQNLDEEVGLLKQQQQQYDELVPINNITY
ncbi:MAG: FHA domain-containing protein [Paludibacteraceae bacterium]|nr:FHA domain-containing protein [Paludibacteraceae bacterium]